MTSSNNRTVIVEPIENEVAILMNWQKNVQPEDVRLAYEDIMTVLQQTSTPIYVIVDLTANPQMPMSETLRGALYGPYGHPMLKQWLVVGKHQVGQVISRLLEQATRKKQVIWFDTMEEARQYLAKAEREAPA